MASMDREMGMVGIYLESKYSRISPCVLMIFCIIHFVVQALNPGLDRVDKMTSSMTSSTTSLNKPGRRVLGHRSK